MELPPRQRPLHGRRRLPQPRLALLLYRLLQQRLQQLHHPDDVLVAGRSLGLHERPTVHGLRLPAPPAAGPLLHLAAHAQAVDHVLALFEGERRHLVAVAVFEIVYGGVVGRRRRQLLQVTGRATQRVRRALYHDALFADELEDAVRDDVDLVAFYRRVHLYRVGRQEEGEQRGFLAVAGVLRYTCSWENDRRMTLQWNTSNRWD